LTAEQSKGEALEADLENRLDELFGDDNAQMIGDETINASDERLADLKSSVLSIDWEITDDGLQQFASQIGAARENFAEDKIVLMFLQILGSLGDYIKSKRGRAHPKTFKTLTAVFSGLESVVSQPDMPEMEKKKTLQVELKRYNDLRGLIQKRKADTVGPRASAADGAPEAGPAATTESTPAGQRAGAASVDAEAVTPAMLLKAINDLKEFVRVEIEALRKEISR
jgi:hypothetical protein